MNILVAGADKTQGSDLTRKLRERGHKVYTAQNEPEIGADEDDPLSLSFWFQVNWKEPQESIAMVNELLVRDIKFDAIYFCIEDRPEPQELRRINAPLIAENIQANVLNPVCFIPWAVEFEVLKKDGVVIFYTSQENFSSDLLTYKISKDIITQVVDAFMLYLPRSLTYHIVTPPKAENIDRVTATSVDLLVDYYPKNVRVEEHDEENP